MNPSVNNLEPLDNFKLKLLCSSDITNKKPAEAGYFSFDRIPSLIFFYSYRLNQ